MDHKIALITGAAGGIGRTFAASLAGAGYRLILVDVNQKGLDETVSSLGGASVRTVAVDLSSSDAVKHMVEELGKDVTRLDLLVNCAAILGDGAFAQQPIAQFARVIQIDLMGTVHLVQAVLPWLRTAHGRILILASTAALHGWPLLAAYSAAKGAIANFADALRVELAREGISVTTVFPLLVDTPLLQKDHLPPILKGKRIPPEAVVEKALRGAEGRKARVYVPWTVRVIAAAHGIAPSLLDWWGARFGFRGWRATG